MPRTSGSNSMALELELPSTSKQESILRVYMISVGINNVLFGIYIIIYIFTIYLYKQKKRKQKSVVVIASTVLLAIITAQKALAWYHNDVVFIQRASTRESVYVAETSTTPAGLHLFSDILFFGGLITVDFLMVWRCYHVWGNSWRIILIPSILLSSECAIVVSLIVVSSVHISDITPSVAKLLNTLQITLYSIPGVISIMINKNPKFRKIIDIIVQSSVIYTVTLVCAASTDVTIPRAQRSVTKETAFSFISSLLNPISGIVSTLMVARVGMIHTRFDDTTMDENSRSNLSGLQFVSSGRVQTSTAMPEEEL